uniref:serine/threonine-protein kinase LMTK2-like n=1 Tax=Myxine glutinosa TaxID=7769 RepID=UPI0035900BFC
MTGSSVHFDTFHHLLKLTVLLCHYVPGVISSPLPDLRDDALDRNATGSFLVPLLISFATLTCLITVLFMCTCCFKSAGFKEFEFGNEFTTEDFAPPLEDTPLPHTPHTIHTADVYVLSTATRDGFELQDKAGLAERRGPAREDIRYVQELGQGWFGKVLLAEICSASLPACPVVIEQLDPTASAEDHQRFMKEHALYRAAEHQNILRCLGHFSEVPSLVLLEFCELGDLKAYMKRDGSALDAPSVSRIACEMAAGLTEMHRLGFAHGDLALRSWLLNRELVVKLGDYGLAYDAYPDDYVSTAGGASLPLRWLAPELLQGKHGDLVVDGATSQSDIWSFGVAMWELLDYGTQPYSTQSDRDFSISLLTGQLVKLPEPHRHLPHAERWYEVLCFCWLIPDKRPTADEVHRLLQHLHKLPDANTEPDSLTDFDRRWHSLKPSQRADVPGGTGTAFPILKPLASFGDPSEEVMAEGISSPKETVSSQTTGLTSELFSPSALMVTSLWQDPLLKQTIPPGFSNINWNGTKFADRAPVVLLPETPGESSCDPPTDTSVENQNFISAETPASNNDARELEANFIFLRDAALIKKHLGDDDDDDDDDEGSLLCTSLPVKTLSDPSLGVTDDVSPAADINKYHLETGAASAVNETYDNSLFFSEEKPKLDDKNHKEDSFSVSPAADINKYHLETGAASAVNETYDNSLFLIEEKPKLDYKNHKEDAFSAISSSASPPFAAGLTVGNKKVGETQGLDSDIVLAAISSPVHEMLNFNNNHKVSAEFGDTTSFYKLPEINDAIVDMKTEENNGPTDCLPICDRNDNKFELILTKVESMEAADEGIQGFDLESASLSKIPGVQGLTSPPDDEASVGKSPYRDSAYFSDLELDRHAGADARFPWDVLAPKEQNVMLQDDDQGKEAEFYVPKNGTETNDVSSKAAEDVPARVAAREYNEFEGDFVMNERTLQFDQKMVETWFETHKDKDENVTVALADLDPKANAEQVEAEAYVTPGKFEEKINVKDDDFLGQNMEGEQKEFNRVEKTDLQKENIREAAVVEKTGQDIEGGNLMKTKEEEKEEEERNIALNESNPFLRVEDVLIVMEEVTMKENLNEEKDSTVALETCLEEEAGSRTNVDIVGTFDTSLIEKDQLEAETYLEQVMEVIDEKGSNKEEEEEKGEDAETEDEATEKENAIVTKNEESLIILDMYAGKCSNNVADETPAEDDDSASTEISADEEPESIPSASGPRVVSISGYSSTDIIGNSTIVVGAENGVLARAGRSSQNVDSDASSLSSLEEVTVAFRTNDGDAENNDKEDRAECQNDMQGHGWVILGNDDSVEEESDEEEDGENAGLCDVADFERFRGRDVASTHNLATSFDIPFMDDEQGSEQEPRDIEFGHMDDFPSYIGCNADDYDDYDSWDSEEEAARPVPEVIIEQDDGRDLKGLLRASHSYQEPENAMGKGEDLDKRVSFFDNVTLHLFDKEAPTNRLTKSEGNLHADTEKDEPMEHETGRVAPGDAFSNSEDSSEEGGGFEWDDDMVSGPRLSILPRISLSPIPKHPSRPPPPPPLGFQVLNPVLDSQPPPPPVRPAPPLPFIPSTGDSCAHNFSRFSNFPNSMSFTHISDSDTDSTEGNGEDGEKE